MSLIRWLLLPLGLATAGARAELVYANTNLFFPPFLPPIIYTFTNTYNATVPDGQGGSVVVPAGQVGDSILLTGPGEFERFQFGYRAAVGPNGTLDGSSLVLRFYANDGAAVAVPGVGTVHLPGSLLFQSDPFPVQEGNQVVTLADVPNLLLPQDLTWTVEFLNFDFVNGQFGMFAYDPPSIGANPGYYLTLEADDLWVINPPVRHPNDNSVFVPANFPATLEFVPIPEPGVTVLAGLGAAAVLVHSRRRFRRRV